MTHTPLNSINISHRPLRTSPPSRALAAYLKASDACPEQSLDKVSLSEAAQAKNSKTSFLLKGGSLLALGVAALGVFGCSGAAAMEKAAPVQPAPVETVSQYQQAGREVRQVGIEIGRQGKEIGLELGKEGQKVGKEAAKVGKEIGKEATKVGKEIGRQGAEFGKDVGKAAKGFWKGLTGK